MVAKPIVVIGASTGGFIALQKLAAGLPKDFAAPIAATLHIGAYNTRLPELISRAGPLTATFGKEGEIAAAGRIYLAPPDHHLIVRGEQLSISRGPKENYARPAIDPLFRTAALSRGSAVIGILLTGRLDDGTVGLKAIKECGGLAIVQDPTEAQEPQMPATAIRYVSVDHVAKIAEIARMLPEWVAGVAAKPSVHPHPRQYEEEEAVAAGGPDPVEHLKVLGRPSTFVCPDCHGSLWEIVEGNPPRYRCHAGHAFTLQSLNYAQTETTGEALWSAVRALQEKHLVLKELAQRSLDEGDREECSRLHDEAAQIGSHAALLRKFVAHPPPD